MTDKSWKAWERTVANLFGGKRRGADFRGSNAGKSDVIAEGWSIECKLLARPTFGQMLDAAFQAEAAAQPGELPVAVVKRKGDSVEAALAIMLLPTFVSWFVPEIGGDAEN